MPRPLASVTCYNHNPSFATWSRNLNLATSLGMDITCSLLRTRLFRLVQRHLRRSQRYPARPSWLPGLLRASVVVMLLLLPVLLLLVRVQPLALVPVRLPHPLSPPRRLCRPTPIPQPEPPPRWTCSPSPPLPTA